MKDYKRILKTGALAVVVTIAFGLFANRAAEWSKGLNSEFLVLGQSGGTGGGGTGGTGTVATTTKVIPQIAIGSFDRGLTKYSTVIEVINTSSSAVTVSGNFYNQDGTAATTSFTANLTTVGTVTSALSSTSLATNAALVLTGASSAAGKVTWGKILSTGSVTIASFFEIRDGATNVLYSRVGVPASAADMASFVIPRLRNTASGVDAGFALVNTGSTSATLVGTLRDANGNVISGANGSTTSITLGANKQTAVFAADFFKLSNEASGINYQYMVFDA